MMPSFLKPEFSTYISIFYCRGYIAALVLDLSQETEFEVQNCMLAINLKGDTLQNFSNGFTEGEVDYNLECNFAVFLLSVC
jgi:hypothetical protein